MRIPDFQLERYFARHEFSVIQERAEPYRDGLRRGFLLCSSDLEALSLGELLQLADASSRELWDKLTLGYCESQGHPALREEISRLYQGVRPEQILTFAGAQEAIFILMNVLLQEGDHAIVSWPGYQSLYEVARSCGAEVDLLELKPQDGWQLDPERVIDLLRPNTRLIVVNFPHNPTGAALSQDSLEELIALAEANDAYLLVDEVYRHLGEDPSAAADLSERGLSLNVMSKSFGLAGLRIGWLAVRDPVLFARLAAYKDYTTICNSAPSEILALIGLRARETLWQRSRGILASNLLLLDEFFARHRDRLDWVRPQSGSTAFPRLLLDEPVDIWSERLLREEGVLLLPGTVYGHPGNHFRLGLGRSDLPLALARLDAFLS